MKRAALLALTLVFAASWQRAQAVGAISGGSVNVARWAADTQGQVSTGGSFTLNSTIGETAFSSAAAGGLAVKAGYMNLAAQPGSVVAITAVTKSTGTLQLAWAAPGADGFLGAVPNGVYRLDYSSDPAHTFSPTSYLTEFSTSVTPGDAQQLTLEGLQPNTTYYTRIYLGDAGRVMAGDSARSAESTLADVPVAPIFSAISACSVTISWTLPKSAAAGYDTEASTTSFGVLAPGGVVKTVSTANGLQVNLTLAGLSPSTQYYFRVASLNWQGDKNFTTLITAVTSPGSCQLPVSGLTAAGRALSRAVTLTWVNPSAPSPEGVVVMLSTSPAAANVPDYTVLNPGQVLADGSVVKSTGTTPELSDSGLTLDTTFFYHLMAKYAGPVYSVGVSTSVFLDLPPMAPAGLTAALNAGGTAVQLAWKPVSSNIDGSAFASTSAPRNVELDHYLVEKSSSVGAPSWIAVATLPITAQGCSVPVSAGDPAYIYRVSAIDSLGTQESAMGVDTAQSMYVFSDDQVARLTIPPALSTDLLAANNQYGSNLLIRAVNTGADATASVFNSVKFQAVRSPGDQVVDGFSFSKPELTVAVHYDVAGGKVAPAGASVQTISAGDAAQRLGLYWNNGEKYVKLYGNVDTVNQLVSVKTSMTGDYQIRALYRDESVHFDVSNLTTRVITPNGDHLNDEAVFVFDNPRDSAYSGKIYDLSGAFVADMTDGPVANSLQWNGKAGGRVVNGGAYVYQIKAEGRTFNGTLLVVR
jgi:hypothetical protein